MLSNFTERKVGEKEGNKEGREGGGKGREARKEEILKELDDWITERFCLYLK